MTMEKFTSYLVGIKPLDDEHWWMFSKVSTLEVAGTLADAKETMDALLTEWERHTSIEEAFMDKAHFPMLEAHAREHRTIHDTLLKLQHNLCSAPWTGASDAASSIETILMNHIGTWDKEYTGYVQVPRKV